ncbi:hypothetical protein EG68_07694 [Paragonimus skrjabini miyazakii]|uniref:Uncharacterized protein n=1 Tax=Paragonimus skrjabini miyazakii TaxID=59628 RepID=A0A8S9YKG4_9TREM|nr:hypothetical protein EG68_07694 [Paragonimus skrjabini miyazakii]
MLALHLLPTPASSTCSECFFLLNGPLRPSSSFNAVLGRSNLQSAYHFVHGSSVRGVRVILEPSLGLLSVTTIIASSQASNLEDGKKCVGVGRTKTTE